MNLSAECWIRVTVLSFVGVKRESAVVLPEVRRLDSLSVVVCAGAGFLFEFEVVVRVAFVSGSAGSVELKMSALARFNIL